MKKILLVLVATAAVFLLTSCSNNANNLATSSGGRTATPITGNSGNYGAGLTDPMNVFYTGDIYGSFTDDQFVPVMLCDGQIVWAKFAGSLEQEAVFINQKLEKGCKAHVQMRVTTQWFFFKRFTIVSAIVTCPVDSAKTDSIVKKQPVQKSRKVRSGGNGGNSGNGGYFPNTDRYELNSPTPTPQPTTVIVQQPCSCGTTVNITNSTINAPINTGNGNGTSDIMSEQPFPSLSINQLEDLSSDITSELEPAKLQEQE